MKPQSIDTHPDAERVLISLIRKKSAAEKLRQVFSLSQTVIRLSKRAIARANPGLNDEQINLLFIEYHYGKDLADRVRKYLEKKYLNASGWM